VNIGNNFALFEAIHGSAPQIAGKDIANPSGLLLAAIQMLLHIEQEKPASLIQNAWLKTIEDGIHTADIYHPNISQERVGTQAFAEAIISRLGQQPSQLKPVAFQQGIKQLLHQYIPEKPATKDLVGVDLFISNTNRNASELAGNLKKGTLQKMDLKMITNRGTKVWPEGFPETFCTDHWRCRFTAAASEPIYYQDVLDLMEQVNQQGLEIIKTENLYTFDGIPGFTAAQGQ